MKKNIKIVTLSLLIISLLITGCSSKDKDNNNQLSDISPDTQDSTGDFKEVNEDTNSNTNSNTNANTGTDNTDAQTNEYLGPAYYKFENGVFTYEIVVNKPTPCHFLESEVSLNNGVFNANINISTERNVCARVVTQEIVSGKLSTDIEPATKIIKTNLK